MVDYLESKEKPIVLKIWKAQKGIFGIPFNQEIDELINERRFLCVREEGKIIAIGAYKRMKRSNEIRLSHLWTAYKYRGQGLQRKIISRILEDAGDGELTVYCRDGAENNSFYEKYKAKEPLLEERKTIKVRKYWLDREKIAEK